MAGGGGGEEGEFGLQIAPMLDVMFVLLLFFMVAAGSAASKEGELGIKIPGLNPASNPGTGETPIIVSIDAEGAIRYNDQLAAEPSDVKLDKLRDMLKDVMSRFNEQPVIVSPEGVTRHERVMQVLDACTYAGVKKLSFRYSGPKKSS